MPCTLFLVFSTPAWLLLEKVRIIFTFSTIFPFKGFLVLYYAFCFDKYFYSDQDFIRLTKFAHVSFMYEQSFSHKQPQYYLPTIVH